MPLRKTLLFDHDSMVRNTLKELAAQLLRGRDMWGTY